MSILFIPEEGWFGQPKYSTFLKKVILRCIGLCFHYHHLPVRQYARAYLEKNVSLSQARM